MPDDSNGEVSEVTSMAPGAGRDGAPGTDDGVPPAEDAQQVMEGVPKDYDDGETTTPR